MKPSTSRGRRLNVREAAAHIGVTASQMRGLIRARRVPFHQDQAAPAGTARRGSNYYFYTGELDAYLDATLVSPKVVTPAMPPRLCADISDLLPAERSFS